MKNSKEKMNIKEGVPGDLLADFLLVSLEFIFSL
jgi:hypothetical protein